MENQNVLAPKLIEWNLVKNIVNACTNQLYLASEGVDPIPTDLAYISLNSIGGRHWELEEEAEPQVFGPFEDYKWIGLKEGDVKKIILYSATSRSGLRFTKIRVGLWGIRFVLSDINPAYRGWYYEMYSDPKKIKPITDEYANRYAKGRQYVNM